MFVCLRVYEVLRVQQGYELVRYELSPLHSSKWSHHSLTHILAAQRNCQPIRIVFVFSSQKSSGCICKSKWRSTTSNSANKWMENYSSSILRVIITRSTIPSASPPGSSIGINVWILPSKHDQIRSMMAKLKAIGITVHLIMLCETFITSLPVYM